MTDFNDDHDAEQLADLDDMSRKALLEDAPLEIPTVLSRWECPDCGYPTPRGARHGLHQGRAVLRTYVAVDALTSAPALKRAGNCLLWAASTGHHPDATVEGAAEQIINTALVTCGVEEEAIR